MKNKSRVEEVFERSNNHTTPILLKFENGRLNNINKKNTSLFFTKSTTTDKDGALFATSDQIYHGFISEDPGAKLLTDTYICIRNKATNKLRILPMDEVLLRNEIYKKIQTPANEIPEERVQEKLLKEFGGRRAARYIDNKEKMTVNMSVVKDDLTKSITNNSINEENDVSINNDRNQLLLPKVNMDALDLSDVYNLTDIISKDLLDAMEEEAKSVYALEYDQIPITSEFLKSHISHIQKSAQSGNNFSKLKVIIYMDALLNLIHTRARLIKNIELSKITTKVEYDVRRQFSDPGAPFTRTAFSREKGICYYIVLALLLSDKYDADMKQLSKDLGISQIKLLKYAQMIGAKRKGTGSDYISLSMPTQFKPLAAKAPKKRAA